jgi:hypothetical protein
VSLESEIENKSESEHSSRPELDGGCVGSLSMFTGLLRSGK